MAKTTPATMTEYCVLEKWSGKMEPDLDSITRDRSEAISYLNESRYSSGGEEWRYRLGIREVTEWKLVPEKEIKDEVWDEIGEANEENGE